MSEKVNQPEEEKERGVSGPNNNIVETAEGTVVAPHYPASVPLQENPIEKRNKNLPKDYMFRGKTDEYKPENAYGDLEI